VSALKRLGFARVKIRHEASAEAAWERAMKVQEVILRAMAKRITWWQLGSFVTKTLPFQKCLKQSPL